MIHTVKGFGIVNKAEIDVFLELSCFFNDPADIRMAFTVKLDHQPYDVHGCLYRTEKGEEAQEKKAGPKKIYKFFHWKDNDQ